MDAAFNLEGYTTEVTVPEDSPAAGITVKTLEDLGEGEIEVITLLRGGRTKGDGGGHNPVNTRPPEEYLCLVGGASNAWSGFVYHDPAQNKQLGMPHPRNLWGVSQYVTGYPGKPASTRP